MPLKSRIKSITRALPKALDKAAKQTADLIKRERDSRVPVDTGDLLDSGEVLAGEQLGEWIVREGAGLPDARASYTEWGTDTQVAQPHMAPAAEIGRRAFPGTVASAVRGVVK